MNLHLHAVEPGNLLLIAEQTQRRRVGNGARVLSLALGGHLPAGIDISLDHFMLRHRNTLPTLYTKQSHHHHNASRTSTLIFTCSGRLNALQQKMEKFVPFYAL
jgi:hypothetical protein